MLCSPSSSPMLPPPPLLLAMAARMNCDTEATANNASALEGSMAASVCPQGPAAVSPGGSSVWGASKVAAVEVPAHRLSSSNNSSNNSNNKGKWVGLFRPSGRASEPEFQKPVSPLLVPLKSPSSPGAPMADSEAAVEARSGKELDLGSPDSRVGSTIMVTPAPGSVLSPPAGSSRPSSSAIAAGSGWFPGIKASDSQSYSLPVGGGGPKRPYLLSSSEIGISNKEEAAKSESNSPSSLPNRKVKLWMADSSVPMEVPHLPNSAPMKKPPAAVVIPPPQEIATAFLRPVPRQFRRATLGGGESDPEDVEETVIVPAARRANSVSALASPG